MFYPLLQFGGEVVLFKICNPLRCQPQFAFRVQAFASMLKARTKAIDKAAGRTTFLEPKISIPSPGMTYTSSQLIHPRQAHELYCTPESRQKHFKKRLTSSSLRRSKACSSLNGRK